jgi:hypothetical protein
LTSAPGTKRTPDAAVNTEHSPRAFVRQMETGRLPKAAFQTFLVQDYLFRIPAPSPEIFGARLRAGSARRVAIDGQRSLLFMLGELRKTVGGSTFPARRSDSNI